MLGTARKKCDGIHPPRPLVCIFEAGIGDRDETLPRFGRAHNLLHALEKVLLENIRLKRAAGFARHDENRLRQINLALDRANFRRIGGIEDVDLRKARDFAERQLQHFDAQARSAHAQKQHVRESGRANFFGNLPESARDVAICSSTMPSQPSHLLSSVLVQSEASRAQSRFTFLPVFQSSSVVFTDWARSAGN